MITKREPLYNLRQILEILEHDARHASLIANERIDLNPSMEKDRIIATTAANVYNHILYLIESHLGSEWGKKD